MDHRPLCFVLMPFGKKDAGGGLAIDFDKVYDKLIKPAVLDAGLEPLRADEEDSGGIIHKPMFERLVLCDFAVADLTLANANVFYELGVRHAAKSRTTVLLFAEGRGRLPFDVQQLRAIPYEIDDNGIFGNVDEVRSILKDRLISAKKGTDKDSPLFQLLDDYPDVAHEKTDVFRERVRYAAEIKEQLRVARGENSEAVVAVEKTLGNLVNVEAGILIDLLLSYRAVSAYGEMIRLGEKMTPIVASTVLVREQLALARNRLNDRAGAEKILVELIDERGGSSESYGILGRVYKDQWLDSVKAGKDARARGELRKAIATYLKGFEADWRDAYPGINALTLLTIENPDNPEIGRLAPVVQFALDRSISSNPDYWDYATRLELAVLRRDRQEAVRSLEDALAHLREGWEAETTAKNLGLIDKAWGTQSAEHLWMIDLIDKLETAAKGI
jgi:tetratricopeptide (TPR) repeat protein